MTDSGRIFISYKSDQRQLAFMVRDKLREWDYETWMDVDTLFLRKQNRFLFFRANGMGF